MFFVVDKPRLQRLIAITREDRKKKLQGKNGPYFRIEASESRLKLTGLKVEAEFTATVYEEGVLFLRMTLFRKALKMLEPAEQIAIQVRDDALYVGDVTMPLKTNGMVLFHDPAQAPPKLPLDPPKDEPKPQRNSGWLFD